MKLGEVYKFPSDQAIGHIVRDKLQIFVTSTDHFRAPAENVFLFISSSDYGGCFPIKQSDYDQLLKHDSFISCGNLVFYSDEYLKKNIGATVGQISIEHLRSLHGHLVDCEQMALWQIQVACKALAAAF